MTILERRSFAALDEGTHDFISTFMMHVTSVSGYGANHVATVARIKTLLLTALARGGGRSSSAWSLLHHEITEIVTTADAAGHARDAHDYLQTFIRENGDLANA